MARINLIAYGIKIQMERMIFAIYHIVDSIQASHSKFLKIEKLLEYLSSINAIKLLLYSKLIEKHEH